MTEAEKNEIVGLVMTEISSQAVDFDIATEQPQANDLLTAVREVAGRYVGVTLKWDDVARIATELANQAATRAEQAKTNVENMKSSVEQTVTDFNALAEEKKQEVQGVYQTDLNKLNGDIDNKLPKSPSDWESWTAEEQAVARKSIGVSGDYKLIDTITINEDSVLDFTFPYQYKNVLIIGKINKFAAKQSSGYLIINNKINYPAPFEGIPDTYTTNTVWSIEIMTNGSFITIVNTHSSNIYMVGVQKSTRYLSGQSISSLKSTIAFLAGTELIVYGVRA